METVTKRLKNVPAEYRPIPFWSWNDQLDAEKLKKQIRWMSENGIGGFFMHARSGLKTEYLSDEWMQCVKACADEAQRLGLKAWIYDDNGWPSGFVGGKLLENPAYRAHYLTCSTGDFDPDAFVSYRMDGEKLVRIHKNEGAADYLNLYDHVSRSNVDILNPEVVNSFLAETHERYKHDFGKDFSDKLEGFFTDEPQYYRWKTPYTEIIAEWFCKEYGEDILDGIGLLFVKKQGYRSFRYRYWLGMQRLMLNNFAQKVYEWCGSNGVKLTGHYVEENSIGWQLMCCGGVMPFYEFEHMAGIDCLGRDISNEIPARQLGSAAAQLGKKQSLTETFACCGWDVTPAELKRIAECQYVCGVNQMCQHLIPYSERGRRKRDYPAHYAPINPWIENGFSDFNDYFSRLGYLMTESRELVNTAMLHPMRSGYFDYQREEEENGFGIRELDTRFYEQQKMVADRNIPFHFLDETLLERHGFVQDKWIGCGCQKYRFLIIPTCYTIGKDTAELIRAFVSNGGKLLLLDGAPEYLEWNPCNFPFLKSNITLDEIAREQPYRIAESDPDIRSTLRKYQQKRFLFLCNFAEKEGKEVKLTFSDGTNGFDRLDLQTMEITKEGLHLRLSPGESAVLFLSGGSADQRSPMESLPLAGPFEIAEPVVNYLPVDFASYSFDGQQFTAPMPCAAIFDDLLSRKYAGSLTLKYSFTVREPPSDAFLLLEESKPVSVSLNGCALQTETYCEKDISLLRARLDSLKIGKNEVTVLLNFYEQAPVYDILSIDATSQSIKNCISYDTEIEPIYIAGNFCVFPKNGYLAGVKENVLTGSDFEIYQSSDHVSEMVTGGYPFFAGTIVLRRSITAEGTDCQLRLRGHYLLADIEINGRYAGRLLFSDTLDVSRCIHSGENDVVIRLAVGNRNLFGPHHYAPDEDPYCVNPGMFELSGLWKNGGSDYFLNRYALVKNGIFES